ncbi:MAG: M48 family metallopeptidase [Planctomycetota bacterium]
MTRFEPLVGQNEIGLTLLIALSPSVLIAVLGFVCIRRTQSFVRRHPDSPETGLFSYHRCAVVFRGIAGAAFLALTFLTPWSAWFDFRQIHPALQILGDLASLFPFCLSALSIWISGYFVEWKIRAEDGLVDVVVTTERFTGSRFRSYFDFQLRHQFLTVAVPMTIILFASNLTEAYEEPLQRAFHSTWAPDTVLGAVGVLVFILAPILLRYIWRTHSLESGELRGRLEGLCDRIGLRVRDILVWSSDGLMINAAVMGIFPSLRYVLLSDALLKTMTTDQIEAVFGHEAGHVKHCHIQFFLVFAFVGWLIVAGLMEWVGFTMKGESWTEQAVSMTVEGAGILATVLIWCLGFGWLSRRFERQADLFGSRCANPVAEECHLPCGLHPDGMTTVDDSTRVCATGAAIFSGALRRVAALNGIPLEEPSWRHSSIANRIRSLRSMAGDPDRAFRFTRLLRRIKLFLTCTAVVGALASVVYILVVYRSK